MASPNLTWNVSTVVLTPPGVVWVDGTSGDSGSPGGWSLVTRDGDGSSGFWDAIMGYPYFSTVQGYIGEPAGGVVEPGKMTGDSAGSNGSGIDAVTFSTWCTTNGYYFAQRYANNDVAGFVDSTVVKKHATGGYYAVGQVAHYVQDTDQYFGLALGIITSVVGFGAIYGIANSEVSGNTSGALIGAVTAGYGAYAADAASMAAAAASDAGGGSIAAATTGASMDDLIPTDYSSALDSFSYSSGESLVAYSDSENVDFGFNSGMVDTSSNPQNIVGISPDAGAAVPNTELDSAFNLNSTPEVKTNDFGTSFADNGTMANGDGNVVAASAVKALPVAAKIGGAVFQSPQQGVQSGGGVSLVAPQSGPSNTDIVSTQAGTFPTLGSVISSLGSTVQQMTTAQAKTFNGQLGAGGVSTIGGVNTQTIIIAGGALVLIFLLMHAKGLK